MFNDVPARYAESVSKEQVLSQAMALTEEERTEIALRLLDSIDAPDPHAELTDPELVEELERRVRDVVSGKVKTIGLAELHRTIDEELDDR
jgi:putative addiction module component (TIGR02574 family)